jgi:hypothetical protein
MHSFENLLNWKLKAGSHQFPGPDGGTCINEAAVVAAGFPYRPIRSASQMPECFSRPICEYVMWLNDMALDGDRQRLLPYVTRLACADTPEIEKKRAAYLARNARRFWFAPYLNMDAELEVLDRALAIGRQAGNFPNDAVEARLRAARAEENPDAQSAKATALESMPANSILSGIMTWLRSKGSAQETLSLVPWCMT